MLTQNFPKRRLVQSFTLCVAILSSAMSHAAFAASQKDVFKSIQDSMGPQTETSSTPAYLLAGAGVLVLVIVAVVNRRQQKVKPSGALNHPGKLMKQIMREVSLKSNEVKQLKLLAEAASAYSDETPSALTLILCPSLLAKGLQGTRGKVDRKIVAQVVRKFKLNQPGKT